MQSSQLIYESKEILATLHRCVCSDPLDLLLLQRSNVAPSINTIAQRFNVVMSFFRLLLNNLFEHLKLFITSL